MPMSHSLGSAAATAGEVSATAAATSASEAVRIGRVMSCSLRSTVMSWERVCGSYESTERGKCPIYDEDRGSAPGAVGRPLQVGGGQVTACRSDVVLQVVVGAGVLDKPPAVFADERLDSAGVEAELPHLLSLPEALVQQRCVVHVSPVDEVRTDIGEHQPTPRRRGLQRRERRTHRVLAQVLRHAFPDEEGAGVVAVAVLGQRAEQVVALEVQ